MEEAAKLPDSLDSSDRRSFLKMSAGAAAAFGLTSLSFGSGQASAMGGDATMGVDLGSGDEGILNYAYALEQLEAAFYTQAVSTPYANMAAGEMQMLSDIRDHEIVHREFFKAALGSKAIAGLTPNFGKVKFNDRESVLKTAEAFENLGVSAYNGAGKLLKNGDYLLIAGKIVSVEARHAAAIGDLLKPRTDAFAPGALDGAKNPDAVLKAAGPFVMTKIMASSLPKSNGEDEK